MSVGGWVWACSFPPTACLPSLFRDILAQFSIFLLESSSHFIFFSLSVAFSLFVLCFSFSETSLAPLSVSLNKNGWCCLWFWTGWTKKHPLYDSVFFLFFWIHSWIWMDGAQAVCIVSTIDRLGKGKRVGALEGFGFQSFPAFKLDFLHIQRKPACGTYTYYSLTRIIIMMLGCCYCVMTTWSLCIVLRSRADRIELPVQRPWLPRWIIFLPSGSPVECECVALGGEIVRRIIYMNSPCLAWYWHKGRGDMDGFIYNKVVRFTSYSSTFVCPAVFMVLLCATCRRGRMARSLCRVVTAKAQHQNWWRRRVLAR